MNKGLKALETIDQYVDKDYDYCQRGDYDEDYKVIEQELQRLESIDNAKPSEALETLRNMLIGNGCNDSINDYVDNLILPIKQALIKAQEKEELFDYISKFIVNVEISDNGIYYISFRNNTPYLDCIEIDKVHYNKFKKIKESQKGDVKE